LTERKRNQKQSGSEVKTFPVQFSLEELEGNITILTNTPPKSSREQILSQAIKFHLKGDISEAEKYYQYFMNQGFKDPKAFSNYGTILKGLGKLKEAELLQLKAIELKPDLASAHYNLGNILKESGKFEQSMKVYKKSLEIEPNRIHIISNIVSILSKLCMWDEIEKYLPFFDSDKFTNELEKIYTSII